MPSFLKTSKQAVTLVAFEKCLCECSEFSFNVIQAVLKRVSENKDVILWFILRKSSY